MNSNRGSSTAYPADTTNDTLCQNTTSGVTTAHSYDNADRLQAANGDTGLVYDAFGRTTTLPATDTLGATNPVTLAYYANDLVRSQTQNGHTLTWTLDSSLRFRSWTDSTGPVTKTNHYNDGSDSPAWIAENTAGTNWTRNISDLSGGLALTYDQAGTKTWQLTDLHGDTIATIPDTSTPNYQEADEYGNPRDSTAHRYGWLGSFARSVPPTMGTAPLVLDNMLTNTGKARSVNPMTNLAQLLSTVQNSEFALDSSKLRGTATKRADAEGLVKIAKYNRTVGYLASPQVVEELVGAADELARTRRELPLVGTLLSTALRLGIAPEIAVQALVTNREDGAHLDLANLAALIEAAADDLDAAAAARQRLQMPADQDLTLEEVASDLGLDLAQIRADVKAGSASAQYASS